MKFNKCIISVDLKMQTFVLMVVLLALVSVLLISYQFSPGLIFGRVQASDIFIDYKLIMIEDLEWNKIIPAQKQDSAFLSRERGPALLVKFHSKYKPRFIYPELFRVCIVVENNQTKRHDYYYISFTPSNGFALVPLYEKNSLEEQDQAFWPYSANKAELRSVTVTWLRNTQPEVIHGK